MVVNHAKLEKNPTVEANLRKLKDFISDRKNWGRKSLAANMADKSQPPRYEYCILGAIGKVCGGFADKDLENSVVLTPDGERDAYDVIAGLPETLFVAECLDATSRVDDGYEVYYGTIYSKNDELEFAGDLQSYEASAAKAHANIVKVVECAISIAAGEDVEAAKEKCC